MFMHIWESVYSTSEKEGVKKKCEMRRTGARCMVHSIEQQSQKLT